MNKVFGCTGIISAIGWHSLNISKRVSILAIAIATTLIAHAIHLSEARATGKNIPVVNSTVLGANLSVPWSQPVQIADPFEGNYLAVFDRNYFTRSFLNTSARVEVVSLWSRKSIRLLLADSDRDCSFKRGIYHSSLGSDCVVANAPKEVTELLLKVGDQVFRLEGKSSIFEVNDTLAAALRNSPMTNINIRLVTKSGETVDSEIGLGTVRAWQAVYN
jgi:hypothetical protein